MIKNVSHSRSNSIKLRNQTCKSNYHILVLYKVLFCNSWYYYESVISSPFCSIFFCNQRKRIIPPQKKITCFHWDLLCRPKPQIPDNTQTNLVKSVYTKEYKIWVNFEGQTLWWPKCSNHALCELIHAQ